MKELFVQLGGYHIWANQLLIDTINQLPDEKHKLEAVSSFSSLYLTVLHMWDAESIWWQRMKLNEHIKIPSLEFKGSMKELSLNLIHQNRQWQEWIINAGEHMLQHEFKYHNSKRESFKQPVYKMIMHLFNHGTYHRGQLVTILRQIGIEKIPQTDFIVWSRRK
jgi:uncharacterized damage-inducible protein DinB